MYETTSKLDREHLFYYTLSLLISGIYDDLPYPGSLYAKEVEKEVVTASAHHTDAELLTKKKNGGEEMKAGAAIRAIGDTEKEVEEGKAGWLSAHTAETLLNGPAAHQFLTGKRPIHCLSVCLFI